MINKINKIHNINNIDFLKDIQDNSIDSLITDIPYGLQDIKPLELIKENKNNTKGFMNKTWDCLPTIEMLKEFYRVLKTGSYFITTFTTRQDLQCILYYRLMEAGFDINFSPLYYAFSSGFPKASNYSKKIQKHQNIDMEDFCEYEPFGRENRKYQLNGNPFNSNKIEEKQKIKKPTTPEAIYCEGIYSNSLKPAIEVIVVAQKPYNQAKYQQALTWYNERKELLDKGIKEEDLCFYTKNSSGGVNFDKTRIPIENLEDERGYRQNVKSESQNKKENIIKNIGGGRQDEGFYNSQGRFPANILCSDDCLDCNKNIQSSDGIRNNKEKSCFSNGGIQSRGFADSGDLSRYFSLDSWTKKHHPELYKLSKKTLELQEDAEKISPFLFTSKPSQEEKNIGLEEFEKINKYDRNCKSDSWQNTIDGHLNLMQNTHPTIKPIALFNYLITMFSNENDIILDPFSGSGTTCIASILTNRKYIGIDITEQYCKIAEARIKHWNKIKEEKEENEKKSKTLFDI